MNILITGGAGYIGSHVAKQLLETTTYNITILDNLSTGSAKTLDTLKTIRDFKFIELDLKEFDKVNSALKEKKINTIIHFAASIVVPESVENPLKYYMNNTVNTTNLIKRAVENNVSKFIFSSTAAVYGEPTNIPNTGVDESYPTNPINPYGMSKLMSEKVLQDTASVNSDFKYVIFRYFNVAGASADLTIGECHEPETHLIPLVAKTALGKRDKILIYGDDYPTKDGSNLRDYVHVLDLADAHIKAIDFLNENSSNIFNCGYGKGFSVKEVVKTMKLVTNTNFISEIVSRRAGDPAILVSDNRKIKSKMNWIPKYEDLPLICKSAYDWENRLGEEIGTK
ncbi:UDP-glucose 4-epimerase [Arcobacter nitrofigilis DSM 7299]|uniref:UDP-glucose 4-epimerase n=1 Tax=Arcobacter nitrofigilis (strain ATCC 33309 / DSM 7299 / CCUG 15893 / LMG 7604 / NCTC 12251 / CI) TaxID=572480 RepID=D5V6F4_ARCNC|nr:UDP-glucose 4-epimerase GalE [Arcobacter nitrofigilis]ADG94224.1 UDP-glucose 4-epimerase [Arcobacter nitrofigilis DSM 7299]